MSRPLTEKEVHRWVTAAQAQWARDLTFQELRKGVQAVSNLYVHKRAKGGLSRKAADGRGKKAAFAVYYGGLHLLLVQAWTLGRPPPPLVEVADVGCGPGVVGAAIARWVGASQLASSDIRGEHLQVATWTARRLGLRSRTRKQGLPEVVARAPRRRTLWTFGWVLNELPEDALQATLSALCRRLQDGDGAVIFAPLSTRASPWWPRAVRLLTAARPDLSTEEFRCRPDLPTLLKDIDRATRLDHRELGARVLYAPPRT